MIKYVVVFVNSGHALLCKWYGDHYEMEAEGKSTSALKRLADELNKDNA